MDYPRFCGCKGCRTCLLCEKEYNFEEKPYISHLKSLRPYKFCPLCNHIFPGWNPDNIIAEHNENNHNNEIGIPFKGVLVQMDFINDKEEFDLMQGIDEMKWDVSQSGRRKQNFGPKTNFKKKKLQVGHFTGFPAFTKFLQDRFQTVELLKNFQTIEQCSLEYDPLKGASIDPHIDDCWIWGERVVTVNFLADSVLTLNLYEGDSNKYNLPFVGEYKDKLVEQLENRLENFKDIVVRIPMPRFSLIVLYGPARYQWLHSVLREDINERRVCIAYRDFTPPYLEEGKYVAEGKPILKISRQFWDHKTHCDG